jgi:hypothetical protein
MIETALRRRFSKVVASSRVTTGEQGKTDSGWQDKARKVRAVGWGEEGSNFNHAPNIAPYRAHLAMFGNAFSPLNFRHPMSPT